jgi:hypothetical protein
MEAYCNKSLLYSDSQKKSARNDSYRSALVPPPISNSKGQRNRRTATFKLGDAPQFRKSHSGRKKIAHRDAVWFNLGFGTIASQGLHVVQDNKIPTVILKHLTNNGSANSPEEAHSLLGLMGAACMRIVDFWRSLTSLRGSIVTRKPVSLFSNERYPIRERLDD